MPEILLRGAVAEDAGRVSEIVERAYEVYVPRMRRRPGPMDEDYEEILRTREVTLAVVAGEIAGLVVLDVRDEGFLVENVAVDPRHHGEGIGKALLQHAEERARDGGFTSLYLFTHETMTENLGLYARIGYVEYDRRPAGEASVVYLRKELDFTSD